MYLNLHMQGKPRSISESSKWVLLPIGWAGRMPALCGKARHTWLSEHVGLFLASATMSLELVKQNSLASSPPFPLNFATAHIKLVSILEGDTHRYLKIIIHIIVCEYASWSQNISVRSRCQTSVINQVINRVWKVFF